MRFLMYGMLLLLVAAVVFAAKENPGLNDANASRNMTFGQCVAQSAQLKNDCYSSADQGRKTCEEGNETANCKSTYKQAKDLCKKDFKSAKKECSKIKHSAWEGFKASFK